MQNPIFIFDIWIILRQTTHTCVERKVFVETYFATGQSLAYLPKQIQKEQYWKKIDLGIKLLHLNFS